MPSSPSPTNLLVVDAGPLIALARLNRLDLPARFFSRLLVPAPVLAECVAGRRAGAELIERTVQQTPWEVVAEAEIAHDQSLALSLGAGEAAAIAVAQKFPGTTLLIDDWVGRRTAAARGLRVIGVLGILVAARRQGHVDAIRPLIKKLEKTGYHLAPALVTAVLRAVGEE